MSKKTTFEYHPTVHFCDADKGVMPIPVEDVAAWDTLYPDATELRWTVYFTNDSGLLDVLCDAYTYEDASMIVSCLNTIAEYGMSAVDKSKPGVH